MVAINKPKLIIGGKYSRKDLYKIFNVPEEKRRGNWNTGYNVYNGSVFIFINLEVAGRTGHNYLNKLQGDELLWYSKKNHSLGSKVIQRLINIDSQSRYFFTRTDSNDPNFIFIGHGKLKEAFDTTPTRIIWDFSTELVQQEIHGSLPEEVNLENTKLVEGSVQKIYINSFERNKTARKKCIEYYGYQCVVCDFDFARVYGDIGKDYITVHHVVPLSKISQEYVVDPIRDLRTVCPNCHAMLHRQEPNFTIDDLKEVLRTHRKKDLK